jgi:hypothetical protein
MASKLLCELDINNPITEGSDEAEDVELLSSLLNSWFNRVRSTEQMVVGASNEEAVLQLLAKKDYIADMYECGLMESKYAKWLAASPDAIVAIKTNVDDLQVAVVEVKTKVSIDKIAEADRIAKKYQHRTIFCKVDDDTWKECVEQEHSNQVMVQMLVTGLNRCCYIVAKPGISGGKGRPMYMACGTNTNKHMNVYLIRFLIDKVSRVLNPFVYSNTINEVLNRVPKGLPSQQIDIINSRGPFFFMQCEKMHLSAMDVASHHLPCLNHPFSPYATS